MTNPVLGCYKGSMDTEAALLKKVVGFYVCWGCHVQLPLYEGQRRRFCPTCALERQRALGGRRKQGTAKVQ